MSSLWKLETPLSSPSFILSSLGQFQVLVDGRSVRFATDQGRALLAYLAVEADRPHVRSYLAFLLWPDHPESQALNNLRQTLIRLRQALGLGDELASVLQVTPKTLQFNANAATLDLRRFQQLLAQCKAHAHHSLDECAESMQTLEQAAALYNGEFLQGMNLRHSQPFSEWATYVREELHRQVISVLHTLARYYEKEGDYERARAFVARQLTLEPWQEGAHCQMMRVLAKGGQRAAAILQYETCRRVLQEELDVAPTPETTLLYEQIKLGTFERAVEHAVEHAGVPVGHALLPHAVMRARTGWSELPATSRLYGRETELAQLETWLIDERCQVVSVLGMGGIGKTAITITAVDRTARHFDHLLWRTLLNAPPLDEILRDWLALLSADELIDLPDRLDAQLALLLQHLRSKRCLLVLDNLESLFQSGQAGQVRPELAGYVQLFQQLAETQHQSCLMITSREQLQGMARWEEDFPWVRTLRLEGLDAAAAQTLLEARGLTFQNGSAISLAKRYSGNPLALKLVVETIQDLFNCDIKAFLASDAIIFDDIRVVLDQQFSRLSSLEQEILLWLAIEREPIALESLRDNLAPARPTPEIVQALQRRSLLQRATLNQWAEPSAYPAALWTETRFVSPNVVLEYLVDRLIEAVCQEIEEERPCWLHALTLMQAQAKEYVRQSQARLILQPITARLEALLGRNGVHKKATRALYLLRAEAIPPRSYAAGNLLNLLLALELDVSALDLSGLAVWQADLRQANLAGVNLAGADLTRSRFADAFGIVHTVAVSPDGTMVAAGTSGGEIRLWNATNGQLLHIYQGHRGSVRSIAFRPDGKVLASSGEDCMVRLWIVEGTTPASSLEEIAPIARTLAGHTRRVMSVAFHPNSNMLASASVDGTIRIWDVVSGETRALLQEHQRPVWSIVFSPDGNMLASSGADGMICLWDAQTAELTATLIGHQSLVSSLAFDPQGRWLASGSQDYRVIVWDLASKQEFYVLEASMDHITTVAFSPDGELLASAGDDRTIRLWESRTGNPVQQLHGHNDLICAVAFSPDGQSLVSGSADHQVCLLDLQTARIRRLFSGYSRVINSLTYHPSGKFIASGHYDRVVRLWDVEKQEVRQTLHGHTLTVTSVAFDRTGTLLASASDDKNLQVWMISAGGNARRRYLLRGHQRDATSVTFHPDGKTLLSTGEDQMVGYWDMETGQPRRFIEAHDMPIWYVRINPSGTLLATISDHHIHLLDAQSGHLYKEIRGHATFIWSLAFSPDGQTLASGGSDGTIALWDVQEPAQAYLKATLRGHSERVFISAFHPNGRLLASGSADHTVRLWDLQSQQLVHTLKGHTHWVGALAFSPDGEIVASSGQDETIRLWDSQSGASLGVLHVPGPYAGMNISGATGINDAERTILKVLGAVEP